MAEEVSNKTIAILVAVVLVISVVGTWTILSQEKVDLSWYNPGKQNAYGKVTLNINKDLPTNTQSGVVSLTKIR